MNSKFRLVVLTASVMILIGFSNCGTPSNVAPAPGARESGDFNSEIPPARDVGGEGFEGKLRYAHRLGEGTCPDGSDISDLIAVDEKTPAKGEWRRRDCNAASGEPIGLADAYLFKDAGSPFVVQSKLFGVDDVAAPQIPVLYCAGDSGATKFVRSAVFKNKSGGYLAHVYAFEIIPMGAVSPGIRVERDQQDQSMTFNQQSPGWRFLHNGAAAERWRIVSDGITSQVEFDTEFSGPLGANCVKQGGFPQ